ncbi:beta-ketoacyl synthase N-terminal-like domain-containing protein [Desulfocicer niacini]
MIPNTDKIAVVGLSGIFPGAHDVNIFRENILAKKEAIENVPLQRWALPPEQVHSTTHEPDTAASKRAGLITGFKFDPHGFRVTPELLLRLDPLHHLTLSAGKQVISQCYCPDEIKAKTGVILAAISLPTQCTSDIAWRVIMENQGQTLTRFDALSAGVVSVPAALLARSMGLMGGCFTLDAACASSLFAIKLACDQLVRGRADMMIAGGVSRPDSLYTQIGFTQLKALSPSGRCAPFDSRADGLVVGEGTGMVVLKRMADALACGDTIHGVITGAGWSNDIGGNLVAPSSDGQIRAMAAAYQQARWSPGDVQHIECHGSATPVGDGVELNSMKRLWENAGITRGSCAIGSVKSMVGHLLTAAGAAGFIKTLLAMKAKQLPPSLNFISPPTNSPLSHSPFRVQTDPEPWVPQSLSGNKTLTPARRAGVSAFGFGGINAHVLVEEFRKEAPAFYYTSEIKNINKITAQANGSDCADKKTCHDHGRHSGHPMETSSPKNRRRFSHPDHAVAIIGMALLTPRADNLETLSHLMISPEGISALCQTQGPAQNNGVWLDEIKTFAGEFHIPPNQIPDLLPQHLIMLKAAMAALKDAGIAPRPGKDQSPRTRFGAAMGIEFDHGATDFHLGWLQNHEHYTSPAQSLHPPDGHDLRFAPLTANRTLGALGGIVASRIAREFQLGGPCFTLSADAASGIKAIEVGINAIGAGETDLFLCGAVDMAGDLRQHLLARCLEGTDFGNSVKNGNEKADKSTFSSDQIPPYSEGAAAVVLKSLEKALADGDRIYSVITGTADSSGGELAAENPSTTPALEKAYESSLETALKASHLSFADIDFHMGSGHGMGRAMASRILKKNHNSQKKTTGRATMGETDRVLGHTFGISGLVSTIQASLGLYHGLRPTGTGTISPPDLSENRSTPGITWIAQAMEKNDTAHACVACITRDGACSHMILQSSPAGLSPLEDKRKSSFSDKGKSITHPTLHSRDIPTADLPGHAIVLKAHRFSSARLDTPRDIPPTTTGPQTRRFPDADRHKKTPQAPDPSADSGAIQSAMHEEIPPAKPGELPFSKEKETPSPHHFPSSAAITTRAHMKFLDLSRENTMAFEAQFKTLTQLAATMVNSGGAAPEGFPARDHMEKTHINDPIDGDNQKTVPPLFNRSQCLAFAVGTAGSVMGEKFNIIDTYPVRVRLPDEPLMLVDRILSIEGEMCSMGPGKIITQHDVKPKAWYLDGGKAPVSISIEAGQADLFLCSWMGIDHQVKGHRRYRLLDARVTFHRPLPHPGETIEYHIEIDRFLKQGEVYLFFFHYKGYINKTLFISMRDGCAGFFTPQEVENSGGIILKKQETIMEERTDSFQIPVPVKKESYTENQVEALRTGNLETCFGNGFKDIVLGKNMRLPGNRMHLIDRVLSFDPFGGRFGLGCITAEADIHPDDWFLTCHFVDDRVMPGTLMYECCAHALRIFTQRMGWVSPRNDVHYDIIPGLESDLKCRGPVTPETKKARYEIEIKEMGYHPEPYVVADAHMFSDDHRIVLYKNMGMKLVGLSRREIELMWSNR